METSIVPKHIKCITNISKSFVFDGSEVLIQPEETISIKKGEVLALQVKSGQVRGVYLLKYE